MPQQYLPLPGQPSTPPPMGPQPPRGYVGSAGSGPSMNNAIGYSQPMVGGYNDALKSLQNSLDLNNQTYSGDQMRLGTQLKQNQGALSQQLATRGLGNTTIAGTMSQAPLATYNQGMADVGNQAALRGMSGYQNLANMQAQGGSAISNFFQPYGMAEYSGGIQSGLNSQQNQAASALNAQQARESQSQATLQGQIQGGLNTQQNTAAAGLQNTALGAEASRQQSAQAAALDQLMRSLANQRGMQQTGILGQQALQGSEIQSQQQMQRTGIQANTRAAATARQNQLADYQAQQQALEQQRLIAMLHNSFSQANAGQDFQNSQFTGSNPSQPPAQTTYGPPGNSYMPPAPSPAAGQPGNPTVGDTSFNYDNLMNSMGGDYGNMFDYMYGPQGG